MDEAQTIINLTEGQLSAAAKGINLHELSESAMGNLRALCQAKIDAAESFTDACEAVADKANLQPAALSAYVNAVVRDKIEKAEEKASQLALLFDELQ